jgi:transcriptional regulator with XRE-family HTH domain
MDALQEELLKKFGEHVKKIRLESGLTQDDVVLNSFKLTKGTVSDVENGKRNFAFTTLIDLAEGLKKHPRELLNFDMD